jgi:hypothetical protein
MRAAIPRSSGPPAAALARLRRSATVSRTGALLRIRCGAASSARRSQRTASVLDDPVTRALIDFARPVAVLFVAVLHFLTDEDRPWEQVAAFRWRMTSGSMLAVSHITADDTPLDVQATIQAVYAEASAPAVFRTRRDIETFFGGLDLAEPGLVEVGAWRCCAIYAAPCSSGSTSCTRTRRRSPLASRARAMTGSTGSTGY